MQRSAALGVWPSANSPVPQILLDYWLIQAVTCSSADTKSKLCKRARFLHSPTKLAAPQKSFDYASTGKHGVCANLGLGSQAVCELRETRQKH